MITNQLKEADETRAEFYGFQVILDGFLLRAGKPSMRENRIGSITVCLRSDAAACQQDSGECQQDQQWRGRTRRFLYERILWGGHGRTLFSAIGRYLHRAPLHCVSNFRRMTQPVFGHDRFTGR